MNLYGSVPYAIGLLQYAGRVTYETLQRELDLDDEHLQRLTRELLFLGVAVDEVGQGLVWTGKLLHAAPSDRAIPVPLPHSDLASSAADAPQSHLPASDAERRQITVVFCDLVDSTRPSQQLDPEDYRAVVRAYQTATAAVVQRYEGHIAQYLGDGIMVYFGWPRAHENAAQRAVHASLEMIDAMAPLNAQADVQARQGEIESGLHLIASGLETMHHHELFAWAPELYREQGNLLLQQASPDVAQASACFEQALTIAGRQEAKGWELRAAMDLACLRRQQGVPDEGRSRLAAVYDSFTEGFDTADLRAARALLDELGT